MLPTRKLPPLNALRAFHAAGRTLSFRAAAEELAVTQGAAPDASFSAHDLRIVEEVHRLRTLEQFRPSCVMRYDRHAYFLHLPEEAALGREPLRVTFDHDIAVRFDDLTPRTEDDGCTLPVLHAGQCLMEVKGATAAPYDFARFLSGHGIFPRPFSKYAESVRQYGATPALSAS